MLGLLALNGSTRIARRCAVALVALALPLGPLAPAGALAAPTTALAVQVATPARALHGSDGREHIDYDLVITNLFTAPARLESIRILSHGRLLLALSGRALAEHTLPVGGTTPTTTVAVSSAVKTLVDIVLPRSFGRRAPSRLAEQIRYTIPRDAPSRVVIASTVVRGPTVRVDATPIPIASPVRGAGWFVPNGCCVDPTAEHRTLLLPAGGTYRTAEMFALDWIRETGRTYFKGDGTKLTDWVCYGTPIHAVANGAVVAAIDNRPELPPFIATAQNRTLRGPGDFFGNSVVERIAPGEYAAYGHMQTGSIRVRIGQRLRIGQVIGRLGNSGNTSGPHLHFGIQDRPSVFGSNSLPFEIRSFTFQGIAGPGPRPGTVTVTGKRRRMTSAQPLVNSVTAF